MTTKLGVSIFGQAKSADIPYSEVRRKAERLWPEEGLIRQVFPTYEDDIGQLQIFGNDASAEYLKSGKPTPLKYRFTKEDGKWKAVADFISESTLLPSAVPVPEHLSSAKIFPEAYRMRVPILARAAAVLAVCVVPASGVAQTVDEIVARHVAARGGADKLKAIQTIKITRTVATPFTDIRVLIYRKRPQLYRAEQGPAAGGAALIPRGINPDAAWDTGPGGKITTRPDAAAAEARDLDADFDGLLVDWKQKGHIVTLEGKESLPGGGDTYKLNVTTKSGVVRTIYLDATTYLDRRHTGLLNLPGGRQFSIVVDFGGWKEVNGVKLPFDISEERTGKEPVQSYVIYTEKIEVNIPMDDGLFATPRAQE